MVLVPNQNETLVCYFGQANITVSLAPLSRRKNETLLCYFGHAISMVLVALISRIEYFGQSQK